MAQNLINDIAVTAAATAEAAHDLLCLVKSIRLLADRTSDDAGLLALLNFAEQQAGELVLSAQQADEFADKLDLAQRA